MVQKIKVEILNCICILDFGKYISKYIYFDILISIDKTASYTLAVLVTGRQVE